MGHGLVLDSGNHFVLQGMANERLKTADAAQGVVRAPRQLDPAPAVQPKQWEAVAIAVRSRSRKLPMSSMVAAATSGTSSI